MTVSPSTLQVSTKPTPAAAIAYVFVSRARVHAKPTGTPPPSGRPGRTSEQEKEAVMAMEVEEGS